MFSTPISHARLQIHRRLPPRRPVSRISRCAVSGKDVGPALPSIHTSASNGLLFPEMRQGGAETAAADEHRPVTSPPDLPSLMLDSRIIYIGMPLVSAVSELIIAELFYLQYRSTKQPINIYINSSGTTRQDGEVVGLETEGMAILDTMDYIKSEIYTAGVGIAIGQACMLLSAGDKGKRFMLPNATAMLYQPTVPPTGQRQAIEVQIKWREVLAQKKNFLSVLSKTTGHSVSKLDKDMQRPLYMQPLDAIEYGVIDKIIKSEKKEDVKITGHITTPEEWDKAAGIKRIEMPPQ